MLWHEFEIELFDKKLDEMGITKHTKSKAMVSLENIYSFHRSYNDNGDEVTFIMFMNGDSMQVLESYESVKRIMKCR